MKKHLNFLLVFMMVAFSATNLVAQTVNGYVLYQSDTSRPVSDVVVTLKNLDNNSSVNFITPGNGYYEFLNVIPGNYKLSAATVLPGGGVSFADATLVFLYLLGYYQFTPMQFLASDVNNTNSITWSDYNLIIWHLLFGTPFPSGPWKFESANFTISALKDKVPTGLGGTCSGDVGGTFVPTGRNISALPIARMGQVDVSKGESFSTSINTLDNLQINGTGTIINYPADLLQIESVDFKGTGFEYNIANGQIRIVWGNPETTPIRFNSGEAFVTIHAVAKENIEVGTVCFFTMDANTSLINPNNEEVKSLNFASPAISFVSPSLQLSNFPNPFTSSTSVRVTLPYTGTVNLDIFNNAGQLVKSVSAGNLPEGYQTIDLNGDNMAPGNYICKLTVNSGNRIESKSIRLIKTK